MQVIDWQIIIEKHGPAVWQTAYRLLGNRTDAADCFQETFICALELSQRQRIRSFSALLRRLATTRAIDQLRRRFRRSLCGDASADGAAVPSTNPGPAQMAQQQELIAKKAFTQTIIVFVALNLITAGFVLAQNVPDEGIWDTIAAQAVEEADTDPLWTETIQEMYVPQEVNRRHGTYDMQSRTVPRRS
ncbi:MAG: sigma-70 family RNA polymerase sigma factor [Planctomycetes bacterium]|nr:sigma-70 family RNA polymerase sigma factor [Planctomycetota bacterium]